MNIYQQLLQKYWGYSSFRGLQEEIIQSVANGDDTLGLMPTGGGKSITYQVYSLSVEGICIVVTPLIALMKDQVEGLQKRGIKALAIYSGMTREEIKVAMDNAVWGDYKFLYLSPERIASDKFIERLPSMKVNLIAVDESHCISQWGYDFRPSYLRVSDLKKYLPNVPILALTATATEKVVVDIQAKLLFKKPNVLKKSFVRDNLIYMVREEEDKIGYLLRTLKSAKGSGIVYVRSRRKSKEIAEILQNNQITSSFYNAGLNSEMRNKRQDDWINNKTRVIVATNAFGMGIDKPDVRFVVHFEAPDSLEAYYQEAGRAGRDGKTAVAVLLYNGSDTTRLKKSISEKFPDVEHIKNVYNSLGNYLQVAVGFGKDQSYDFDLAAFSKTFGFSLIYAYNGLKILERDGYIELTDELDRASMVHFRVNRDDLYRFQVANKDFDAFIKLLLRSYTGLFSEYRPIDEGLLTIRSGATNDLIYKYLCKLDSLKVIHYIPRKKTPFIVFTRERIDISRVSISKENYDSRKNQYSLQVGAVINYATSTAKCRSQLLVEYFGEKSYARCGACDVCKSLNNLGLSNFEFERIKDEIKKVLSASPCMSHELFFKVKGDEDKVHIVIKWLIDNELIVTRVDQKLEWKRETK